MIIPNDSAIIVQWSLRFFEEYWTDFAVLTPFIAGLVPFPKLFRYLQGDKHTWFQSALQEGRFESDETITCYFQIHCKRIHSLKVDVAFYVMMDDQREKKTGIKPSFLQTCIPFHHIINIIFHHISCCFDPHKKCGLDHPLLQRWTPRESLLRSGLGFCLGLAAESRLVTWLDPIMFK